MTVAVQGLTFPPTSQWSAPERQLIRTIRDQIHSHFPTGHNLLINTTWFGPQFDNNQYQLFQDHCQQHAVDRLFLISSVDPVYLNPDQLAEMQKIAHPAEIFLLGNWETQYHFDFIATLLPRFFQQYSEAELVPQSFHRVFLCYNRKPHAHRSRLVDHFLTEGLESLGIVTLGGRISLDEQPNAGNWNQPMDLGIPQDVHTLGDLSRWNSHFLNIVSETVANNLDPIFISEKTWKPMIGLRPFVINGQPKIYQYLRDQGFCTFNHYWPHIDIEHADQQHMPRILAQLVKWLATQDLDQLYGQMLPELRHNRRHFADYSGQQTQRIHRIFDPC